MTEIERQRERRGGSGPSAGIWDDNGDGDGVGATATVAHGPYAEQLPVSGMTVGEVRQRFADRLDLADGATALLDGNEAPDDTRVTAGQVLMFVRRAGEKGRTT